MPLKPGSSRKVISQNIHEMVASGHDPKQAVAASLHKANYAEGGEVESGDDDDAIMDHVALECMNAIQQNDKETFKNSFEALVSHIVQDMGMENEGDE